MKRMLSIRKPKVFTDDGELFSVDGDANEGEPASLVFAKARDGQWALLTLWTKRGQGQMLLTKEISVIIGERLIEFGSTP